MKAGFFPARAPAKRSRLTQPRLCQTLGREGRRRLEGGYAPKDGRSRRATVERCAVKPPARLNRVGGLRFWWQSGAAQPKAWGDARGRLEACSGYDACVPPRQLLGREGRRRLGGGYAPKDGRSRRATAERCAVKPPARLNRVGGLRFWWQSGAAQPKAWGDARGRLEACSGYDACVPPRQLLGREGHRRLGGGYAPKDGRSRRATVERCAVKPPARLNRVGGLRFGGRVALRSRRPGVTPVADLRLAAGTMPACLPDNCWEGRDAGDWEEGTHPRTDAADEQRLSAVR
ncbi:hypothetical protein CC2G_007184 [Coprinopsis cinerea AmutBmut pab1-1]|nr:hypothetical protein CC2G_007184 [Coprinopsis cinerea AmutBmut pab1-1]